MNLTKFRINRNIDKIYVGFLMLYVSANNEVAAIDLCQNFIFFTIY